MPRVTGDAHHNAPLHERNIRGAWLGRCSGCQLGKAVEVMSIIQGHEALDGYLKQTGALPLRDYVPFFPGEPILKECTRGNLVRSEPDDDINYTVLALMLLERHGLELGVEDIARGWLRNLPIGATFTAVRSAYLRIAAEGHEYFAHDEPLGFDVRECSDNPHADSLGARIRTDLYGWVLPGRPTEAAHLAGVDAAIAHREDGVHSAVFVAALGAAIPATGSLLEAVEVALAEIPGDSQSAGAVKFAISMVGQADAAQKIREHFGDMYPLHAVNNLAACVWALLNGADDFSVAIGEAVALGWDTDCNGATVGGLWGLTGRPIPEQWTAPWRGRVAVTIAGVGELAVSSLSRRTAAVARKLSTVAAAA